MNVRWYNRVRQMRTNAALQVQRRKELAAGTLKCICSRTAVTIKNNQGVCALCDGIEKQMENFLPPELMHAAPASEYQAARNQSPSPFLFPCQIGVRFGRLKQKFGVAAR